RAGARGGGVADKAGGIRSAAREDPVGAQRAVSMTDFAHPEILDCVRRALAEDIGAGDVTSQACVPAQRMAAGRFIAREQQIVAGVELLPLIYAERGGVDELRLEKSSGACASEGEVIAHVAG